MSFFGGLFGGSNPTLNSDKDQLGGLAGFLDNTGTSDIATSSNFMKTLLSGNSTAVNTLLAPQISGIQKRANQEKQQVGQFGGRSGGTTGSMLALDDETHGQINDLISKLTGSAVTGLGSMGAGLVSQGSSDLTAQAGLSQDQLDNWRNSILGKGISGAINYGESFLPAAHGG